MLPGQKNSEEKEIPMGFRHEAANLYHPASQVPFPLEEYERRRAKVREALAREKIDLLFCSTPESRCYLTGYVCSYYQSESPKEWLPLTGLAVKQDDEKVILFDTEEEQVLANSYTIGTDIRIYNVGSSISELEHILKSLKEEGWLKGTVGLEMGSYRPNRIVSEMFQAALEKEGCRVVDAFDIIRDIRAVKSPLEMACVRTAAKITDIGMKAAIEHIRPGMTEIDLRAEIDYACAKAGGENPAQPNYVLTGQRTAHPHALASRQVIMPGDIVYIDVCGVYHRYHVDTARTLSMGEPHPKVAKQIKLATEAWSAVLLKTIRPNCPFRELTEAMEEYYRKVGIYEDRWWVGGYDLGLAFAPDWPGVFFYQPTDDSEDQVFLPGMVFNYETAFYLPERAGLSTTIDTLAITENSVELLTAFPPDPIVIDI